MSFQEEFNKFAESALLEDEGKIFPLMLLCIALGLACGIVRFPLSFFEKK